MRPCGSDIHDRQELETEVGDAKTARKILESIGFQPVIPVEKQRQCFHRENITACSDNIKSLGRLSGTRGTD